MDLYTYRQFLLDAIPGAEAEYVSEMLIPLAFDKTISPYLDVARVRRSRHLLLSALDNLIIDDLSKESFSTMGSVKLAASHIGKTVATAITTAGTFALINNKEKLHGLGVELKRLKNPSLLAGTKLKLTSGDKFPITKPEVTFNDVKQLVDKHILMLKAVSAFINSSKFHATTIPDVNHLQWLAGLKAMGGASTEDGIKSPVMFGGNRIITTYTQDKWSSKLETVTERKYPEHYINPGLMGLSGHIVYAEKAIEIIWALDSALSSSVTDVYNAIDKRRGSSTVKAAFRKTVHTYYNNVLSATLSVALAYSSMCERAAKAIKNEDEKSD
jgi:hypothetical protein